MTLGTFDLFHVGHVNLLRRCADMGRVIVGLNTDEFVRRYKGRTPVIAYEDREAVLRACRYVSDVRPNAQPKGSAWQLIASVNPDIIAVGSDWADRDYLGQLGIEARDLGAIRIVFLPYTNDVSSTAIRARLAA